MRGQILERRPTHMLRTVPWSEDDQSGKRLAWALGFKFLHEKLCAAREVLELDAKGQDAIWDEVAQTVWWLFNRQSPAGFRFVVESPSALVEKWDRIYERREAETESRRKHPSDNRPVPTFASWDKGWNS